MKELPHRGVYLRHFITWLGRWFPGHVVRSTTRRYHVDTCMCEVDDPSKATLGTVQVSIYLHKRAIYLYATGPQGRVPVTYIRKALSQTEWPELNDAFEPRFRA